MNFYCIDHGASAPSDAKFPCVVLERDSWNDWGYQTLFHAKWHRSASKTVALGDLKILRKGHTKPGLPHHFSKLGPSFCSLGQSLSFYEQVHELGKRVQDEMLLALRDVVAHPQLVEQFEGEKGFQDSLLRFSEAEKAFHEGGLILADSPSGKKGEISFTYSAKLKAASAPHVVSVRFGDSALLPNRIVVFVGKNGTGKTWFLSKLAADISGDDRDAKFKPGRPRFSRVIAISYNSFDRFRRPPKDEHSFSYRYCGIYDSSGNVIPRPLLVERIAAAHKTIIEKNRDHLWQTVLAEVFGQSFAQACKKAITSDEQLSEMNLLSSGQMILLTVFTELLAVIDNESLVLYDEPELHLHPNAISGLMKALTTILNRFDSYGIIATHSPLIVQQIPSDYVRVFVRLKNQTFIRPLGVESFGENLSALTEEVFQVNASETIFRQWVRSASENASREELLGAFSKPLSFNAKTLIRSYLERKTGADEQ